MSDGVDGIALEEITSETIFQAIARFIQYPALLKDLAARVPSRAPFSLDALGRQLIELAEEITAKPGLVF